MLKTKRRILLITLILFIAIQGITVMGDENQDLYVDTENNSNMKLYKTTEVFIGDLEREAQVKAFVTYLDYESVFFSFDYGSAIFEEYLVNQGDVVSEGDPIAKVSVHINDIEVEELSLKLMRLKESYNEYCQGKEEYLKDLKEQIEEAVDTKEKELKTLIYEKNYLEYERGKGSMEIDITQLEEKIGEYEETSQIQYIYANASGIVDEFSKIFSGNSMSNGDYIAIIFDTSKLLLAVENSGKILKYNMPVSITAMNKDTTLELTGRVISCASDVLSPELISDIAYIEINEDTTGFQWSINNMITYHPMTMKNVLLVSLNAVEKEGAQTYVTEYIDNQLYRRYFIPGRFNSKYYWALDGLKEGMTVIVK